MGWIVLAAFVAGWVGFAALASTMGWSRIVGYGVGAFVGCAAAACTFTALSTAGYIDVSSRPPSRAATASATPTPSFDRASDAQLEEIRFFLKDGFTIDHVYSARSEVTRGGYFVAAEITHRDASPGNYFGGGGVALWYHTGEPDDVGLVLAVDWRADEACTCFYSRETQADLRPQDDPGPALTSYVKSQLR